MPTVRAVTFNVWVGQRLSRLRINLLLMVTRLSFPRVVALQESRVGGMWTIKGYRCFAPGRKYPDGYQNRLLIRRGSRVVDKGAVQSPVGWNYGGKPKPPRVFPWVAIAVGRRKRRRIFVFVNVHRIPVGPDQPRPVNERAWDAEHDLLIGLNKDLKKRFPGCTTTFLGDWNSHERKMTSDPHSLKSLSVKLGAIMEIIDIDGFMVVNGSPKRVWKMPYGFGSDGHRPVAGRIKSR